MLHIIFFKITFYMNMWINVAPKVGIFMNEEIGLVLIIIGIIVGLSNIPLFGKIKYHGVSIPGSIVLIIVGAKIAGWW